MLELTQKWTQDYSQHVSRNIGHITPEEQEKLRTTPIGVFGVGGIGGLLSELLVRAGCEHLVICDRDVFDLSNLNRQICVKKHIGMRKIDVVEEKLGKMTNKPAFQYNSMSTTRTEAAIIPSAGSWSS